MQRQTAFQTMMMANRQGFLDRFAAETGLARAVRVDFPDSSSSVFSFVLECLQKVSPTRVSDKFGKMMIFHHLANLQVFNRDFIKPRHQIVCRFMAEVCALARDFQVLFSQKTNRFTAAMRTFPFAADGTLSRFQAAFRLNRLCCRPGDWRT